MKALSTDSPTASRWSLLVAFTRSGSHRHVVGNGAHHQHRKAVHVESERRGRIALRQLLRHQAVCFVVSPEPTVMQFLVRCDDNLALIHRGRRLAAEGDAVIANDVDAHGWGLLVAPAQCRR
jgi:hypothetical protein